MGDLGEYWRDVDAYFKDRARNPEKYFSKSEISAYEKRQAKRRKKREDAKQRIQTLVEELGLELKTYPNGQYSFGKKLDWWTTTGTAVARKSREEYHISFEDTDKLKTVLKTIS